MFFICPQEHEEASRTARIELLSDTRIDMDHVEEICEDKIGKVDKCSLTSKPNEVLVVFSSKAGDSFYVFDAMFYIAN